MWSSNDCRDALTRAIADTDGPLRIIDYRAWRSAQPIRCPTDATVVHRLGPWTLAVRSVGGRTASYTPDDCLKALRSAAHDLGLIELRQDDYQAWAAQALDRPEKQAIRYHLGAWDEALADAGVKSPRGRGSSAPSPSRSKMAFKTSPEARQV